MAWTAVTLFVSAVIYWSNFGPGLAARPEVGTLRATMPLQPAPGKQHIVVTGGAGFIGSHATLLL